MRWLWRHRGPWRLSCQPEFFTALLGVLRVSVSKELLTVADNQREIRDSLLINPQPNSRKTSAHQAEECITRPSVEFSPTDDSGNEKLRKEMETTLPGCFSIENIDGNVAQLYK